MPVAAPAATNPVISISAVGKLVDVDIALRKPLDHDELLRSVERYVGAPVAERRAPLQTRRAAGALNPKDPSIAQVSSLKPLSLNRAQLEEADKLVKAQRYEEAMRIYTDVYGDQPPAGPTSIVRPR